ncbi:MAG: DUF2784 domain-containing protein [Nitrospirae bacterium]|nr:DUF2784 domain-containing protein [Nitrospirota bacterium]
MGLFYRIAADIVVAVHLGWILFLIGGAFIGRRVRWVKWTHLAALGYSVLLQAFSWTCPLTYLELWLWNRTPAGSYTGSFIAHYLEKLIYMEIPRGLLLVLTGIVIGISAVIYCKTMPPRS